MATSSHAQAVKSLNKSPGRRRFVFKNFSQRVEEINIDVYRSLDKLNSEPSEGFTFVRDCLIEWRELNTAEEFISCYEEIMPLVQTLPSILFHKKSILSTLLSRLQIKARLSLEPILRLVASLSRDLLEDFLPFLPSITDSLVSLLEGGAAREPEIIEQIFTSWSCIMMHLQKYLICDLVKVLKYTVKLRYYPKEYVQEFMAEAISFLLRKAPSEQLRKAIRKIIVEVVKKPVPSRTYGASILLCYTIKGASSRFHSRAELVLRLLIDDSIFSISHKFSNGLNTVVEVIKMAFQILCEEINPQELILLWNCLFEEITKVVTTGNVVHLSQLLSLLFPTIEDDNCQRNPGYQSLLDHVYMLVRTFVMPFDNVNMDGLQSEIIDKVLRIMLLILNGLQSSKDTSVISNCSLQWASVFRLKNTSLLDFIQELLLKDVCVIYAFKTNVLSALNDLIETFSEKVVYLLLSFCERSSEFPSSGFLEGRSEGLLRIQSYVQGNIVHFIEEINEIAQGLPIEIHETKLALFWGIIRSYPFMSSGHESLSLLMDLIDALDELLVIEAGNVAGFPKQTWQSLLGAALSSYHELHSREKFGLELTTKVLHLAKRHNSCSQVLEAVANYLDFLYGPSIEAGTNSGTYHQDLKAEKVVDAVTTFAESLGCSDKAIRISTLRILCHYEPLTRDVTVRDQLVENTVETESSQTCLVDRQDSDVLKLLLSIEATPLSISTSRKVILLISTVQMSLSSGRIPEAYEPLVLYGIVGIFHNRFSHLWDPASECLALLISKYSTVVWDKFIYYFEHCLSMFDQPDRETAEPSYESDLVRSFHLFLAPTSDHTPRGTMLSLLIRSLQKIPNVVESRFRQIVPLLLKFLGYNCKSLASVGSFNSHACKGKEWKTVLKEWLNLLKVMRNPKSFYQSQFLKEVLQNRLLDENDAEIQIQALDCLLTWKDDFLLSYAQHLKNLISSKTLREELTKWSLSKEYYLIEGHHRAYIIPLVIRLLMPKVRKLKTLASRKHASLNHRKAVLGFIAQLDVDELPLFFALLMKPMLVISMEADGTANWFWTSQFSSVSKFPTMNFLKYFSIDNITALSWKKRYGFLHVVEDILVVFDELHVIPFLDLLMGCVVRILESCTANLHQAKNGTTSIDDCSVDNSLHEEEKEAANGVLTSTAVKQFKDMRSLCLRILSFVLNKYDDHDFGSEFWDHFFLSVEPSIVSFKQEGSSSEKPSSLFSCFIAMSKSRKLLPLLSREKNLIPDIFSILTVTSASEAIISFVLKFIDNLLTLESELDDRGCAISVLLPNLDALICALHDLFQSNNAIKRKFVKHPGESERRVFKLLSKHIKDPSHARKFVDILLPVLAKRLDSSDICVEAVQIIRDVVPVLGSESTTKVLKSVVPLLIFVELDIRLLICDLLDALAEADPSVFFLAQLLRDLNAISSMEMGALDFDTIAKTYEKISLDFFYNLREDHTSVVLSHFVYDMSSEELILRQSAFRALLTFVQFSAVIVGQTSLNHHDMLYDRISSRDSWTKASILRLINQFLLKHMGEGMSRIRSVKKGWIDLLREMVLKLPKVENLHSLMDLHSADGEVDFFNNITHLQKHRIGRALFRFRNVVSTGNISEAITKTVFVPLFFNMLFDELEGKAEHVRVGCIEALASISGRMEWKSYYALLRRCFREVTMNSNNQKILLRLICSILDRFHFSENVSTVGTSDTVYSAMSHEGGSSVTINEIQKCLNNSVLPKIKGLMNYESGKVDVNVNLAALKILKLLPGEVMDSQLLSIIQHITNFLKNRLESIRDEARSALAACLKELGLEYLQIIVGVMQGTLKRGFELHVLGYSLHFILSKFLSNPISGKLDYCLEDLLSVVEKDILGDVAEEKEVEKIASKMKETRKQKSFETLKLIAQSITFKTQAFKLLAPVAGHLHKPLTPKAKMKIGSMLNSVAAGIENNPSLDQTDLFIFLYGLIEDGIKIENSRGQNSSIAEANKKCIDDVNVIKISSRRMIRAESPCSHLLMVFALRLLHGCVKKVKLGAGDVQLISMLDPFVKLLGDCLICKYEDVLSTSLKCLTPLVRLPLSSIESHADKIKAVVLEIAQSSVDANSPLMQSCLTLITVLLRSTKVSLSPDQLHLLIQFPLFVDLQKNPSFIALRLLKAIISRKLVVAEIYDLATQVAELMVISQVESIRKKCSKILLQFLLDYQLSNKRLQQHLDFLLSNLRYEHSTGREAVLEMLHAIIVKFPRSVVDKLSHTLFVHLVVCLANDQDNNVRSMTGAAIKLLIDHISSQSLHSVLDYSLSWYVDVDGKKQLRSAAAQVLGLLIEVLKRGFERHLKRMLPAVISILQSATDATSRQLEVSDGATIPFWKEAYYTLVMLEKVLHQFPEKCSEKDFEDLWEMICELLLHPHTWIRNISSRLIGRYFEIVTETSRGNSDNLLDTYLLLRPSRLFLVAASLCYQLKTQPIDDGVGNLIMQNLVFAICGVHSFMGKADNTYPHLYWSILEQNEQTHFLKAFRLLDSRKGRNILLSLTSTVSGQNNDDGCSAEIHYLVVSNLLKQMGKIALQMDVGQMKIVFDTFRKFSSQIGRDECQHYAFQLLLPLYKVREGFAGKVIPDAMNQLAQEVCESIQNSLGIQNFVQVYSQIKKNMKAKREKRKQEEKLMAVVNPMRNAKRKLRIAAKNRANKRRRMTTMKMSRWMRS